MIESIPLEIQKNITSYLMAEDLLACCQVSKTWKTIFEENVIWEYESRKWDIKKKVIEEKSLWSSLISMFASNPLEISLKEQVKAVYRIKIHAIPKLLLTIVGGRYEVFNKLPFNIITGIWFSNLLYYISKPVIRSYSFLIFRTANEEGELRIEMIEKNIYNQRYEHSVFYKGSRYEQAANDEIIKRLVKIFRGEKVPDLVREGFVKLF